MLCRKKEGCINFPPWPILLENGTRDNSLYTNMFLKVSNKIGSKALRFTVVVYSVCILYTSGVLTRVRILYKI
jgi:hypothetical protein